MHAMRDSIAAPTTTTLSALLLLATIVVVSHVPVLVTCKPSSGCGGPVKAGYWPFWAPTQNSNFKFQNHAIYAFAQIEQVNATTYKVVAPPRSTEFPRIARWSNPCITTLLSIGGYGASLDTFAAMATTAVTRKSFIDSSIVVARVSGFDGLDLDWEFPNSQVEMDNLGLLFKEWRVALNAESRRTRQTRLLLSTAVYYTSNVFFWQPAAEQRTYPIASMNANVDMVLLMCFDFRGSWESTTGVHTALRDPVATTVSSEFGINNWMAAGLDPRKMVLGLAFYGKQWTLQSLSNTGIGAPTTEVDKLTVVYRDIVGFTQLPSTTTVVDSTTSFVYSFNNQSLLWMGYDNPTTLTTKTQYALSRRLLGVFAWSLDQDDSTWSLARAVSKA